MSVRRFLLTLAASSAFFVILLSCGRQEVSAPVAPQPPAPVAPAADVADPAGFSYGLSLGTFSIRERALLRLEDPFFPSLSVGAAGISMHLLPGDEPRLLYGDPGEVNRFDRSSWGTSTRGDLRYRIEGGTQVVAEEKSPGGAEAEAVYRETWRYRAERTLVAGLLAFDDIVLVATDKPSLVCLDRRDGTPRMEEELPALPEGPLFYLSGLGSLAVFGANGTLSIYALEREASASADPVEALLQPAPEAFALIEVRMRERLAKRDEQSEFLFHAYRPRTEVPSSGIVLYRFDPPASGKYRIYIDGAGKRPCLVELFSYSGEPLASNLDYVGLEPVLEHGLDIGAPYFIAAAFLGEPVPEGAPGTDSPQGSVARLVVAPK
jgi:hypothetical protein